MRYDSKSKNDKEIFFFANRRRILKFFNGLYYWPNNRELLQLCCLLLEPGILESKTINGRSFDGIFATFLHKKGKKYNQTVLSFILGIT